MSHYFDSTTPGKSWSVFFYKAPGRPGIAVATHGEVERNADGNVTAFNTMMYEDTVLREVMQGSRATPKVKNETVHRLFTRMKAEGRIPPETEYPMNASW